MVKYELNIRLQYVKTCIVLLEPCMLFEDPPY